MCSFFTIVIFDILFWFFRYSILYKCDLPQNKKFCDFVIFYNFQLKFYVGGVWKSVEFVSYSTHSSHITRFRSKILSAQTRLSGFDAKKKVFCRFFLFWGRSSSLNLSYPKFRSKIINSIVWKKLHKIFHVFAVWTMFWTQSVCV